MLVVVTVIIVMVDTLRGKAVLKLEFGGRWLRGRSILFVECLLVVSSRLIFHPNSHLSSLDHSTPT